MSKKHWFIIFLAFFIADIISCVFGVFVGGNRINNQWLSIGEPPETATRIVGLQIGSTPGGIIYKGRETKVYVGTITGKIYECCENNLKNASWKEVANIDSNEDIFLEYCGALEQSERVHRPDEKDQRGANWCGEFDNGIISYSLSKDGTVWSRKIYESSMRIFWWQFFTVIVSCLFFYVIYISNNLFQVSRKWKRE